jgi:hypothetical protein
MIRSMTSLKGEKKTRRDRGPSDIQIALLNVQLGLLNVHLIMKTIRSI